jgi:hypothetical protein
VRMRKEFAWHARKQCGVFEVHEHCWKDLEMS